MRWGYKLTNGEVEAKLFDAEKLPKGWVDTPAKLKEKPAKGRKNGNNA